jgi:hypothetical protein
MIDRVAPPRNLEIRKTALGAIRLHRLPLESDSLTSKIRPNNVFFFELESVNLFCIRQEVLAHVYSSC